MATDLTRLCGGVLAGDLACGAPLQDALAEAGDRRHGDCCRLLGRLRRAALSLDRDHAPGEHGSVRRGRRSRSPEELAHRRDEACYAVWRTFRAAFEDLFWPEIHGPTGAAALSAAAEFLAAPKQARRLAEDAGGVLQDPPPYAFGGASDEDHDDEEWPGEGAGEDGWEVIG